MIKRLIQSAWLLIFPLLLVTADSSGQTIGFWVKDGMVAINGKLIPAEKLPDGLDIRGADFMVTSKGRRKFKIQIEGEHYEVTKDGIAGSSGQGHIHFTVRRSGPALFQQWTLTNNRGGLAQFGAPPHYGMEKLFEEANHLYLAIAPAQTAEVEAITEVTEALEEQVAKVSGMTKNSLDDTTRAAMHEVFEVMSGVVSSIPDYIRMAEARKYLSDLVEADRELYAQVSNEWRLEQQAALLARYIRVLPDGTDRNAKINELEQLLNEIFELKQENRRREIAQLKSKLDELEKQWREREAALERLIEARLGELLESER